MSTDQLNIRVDAELKRAFIDRAKEDGTTATELLVGFMRQYLGLDHDDHTAAIDTAAIERILKERLDTRLAEVETRLAESLDNAIAEIEKQHLEKSRA